MISYGNAYLTGQKLRELGMKNVGDSVQVHETCVLVGLENISIGNHVRIDPFCRLIAAQGFIKIGSHVHIGSSGFYSGAEGIAMEDFANIGHSVSIFTHNDDFSGAVLTGSAVPEKYLRQSKGPVTLRRHVVLATSAIVLPNVEVGEGVMVGALSLVKTSLAPWGIYAGVPVRRIRDRGRQLLELEKQLLEEERAELAKQGRP